MLYLGIGSNLGSRINNIEKAKSLLVLNGINITKSSSYYETLSWPDPTKPKFINIVVQSDSKLSPKKLLDNFKYIEKKLGRKKDLKNSPRTCDIDIISYDEMILTGAISIPHTRMHERNFVLLPLYEIDKNWFHPKSKSNIKKLIFSLPIKDIRSIKQF
ncbi:2-amino-4-hydroxy-6-hydroxymethyldihydropteridine diphosphokinase [Candidatus Pelagibacter sp.]|nr:2-amino-4-hydroxy-6-hydroxymethyldihydropteridine diphosphokinase [Candidatus Pelagibacter sp.]MDA9594796.1 2-amino-4-hydroxy-6-hydroxymethyldihydropteridine diphosphokinase [Candidatus Pelagibacter sp.]